MRWPALFLAPATLFLAGASGPVPEGLPEIHAVSQGIARAHHEFFHMPGGLAIRYRLDVEQSKERPAITWLKGLDGSLTVKWPLMKTVNEGDMSFSRKDEHGRTAMVSEWTRREANYDFEANVSVAREGVTLGQIANHRHAFSATTLYPLKLQYYEEADQYFVPGENVRIRRLLPGSLADGGYKVTGQETVGGVECLVVRNATDQIWIDAGHSSIVRLRESRNQDGLLVERVQNEDLRQISPHVWLPFRQSQEVFEPSMPDGRLFKLTVSLTDVRVGGVKDPDLQVTLGKDVRYIEDYIHNTTSLQEPGAVDPFEAAVEIVRATERRLNMSRRGTIIRVNVIIALGLAIALAALRLRSAPHASPGNRGRAAEGER